MTSEKQAFLYLVGAFSLASVCTTCMGIVLGA